MTDTHPLNASATHVIALDDARVWLAEHGFELNNVASCSIEIGNATTVNDESAICAWLDVEWYRTKPNGDLYMDDARTDAVRATSTVPLRSWPPLREA